MNIGGHVNHTLGQLQPDAEARDYVARVLDTYVSLPDTPSRPRRSDHTLALQLFQEGVPFQTVFQAMILATVRRNYRESGRPPLDPVNSLRYFLRVIHELLKNPIDDFYTAYLVRKLDQIPTRGFTQRAR